MASTPIAVTSSKKRAMRSGSALLKSVALMAVRKPRALESFSAATARS